METVVGGLFNAVAFAGAGFLFSKINHTGYEKEVRRHNEAMEKLTRDKEKWYENQMKRKQKMELLRQELSDANADINDTNKSLANLRKIQDEFKREEEHKPRLENYYTPSQQMKEYQNVAVLIIGITSGYVIHKFLQ